MRSIKRRKGSIQSTQQITKAMKLVSTVKLQRAKGRAEKSKAYFECMYATVKSVLAKAGFINHPYLKPGESSKKAVIVITSNRGLAGGYNSNVIKLVTKGSFKKEDVKIYAIGRKGKDAFTRYGYDIVKDYSDVIDLAYTAFKNTVSHIPTLLKLLPVEAGAEVEEADEDKALMNFEQDEEEALNLLIPKYITSLIYGGMVEAVASENGARMQAMDAATSNAEEMIEKLSLQYNRARQGSITQELTEIIAGAEAIS